MMSPSTTADPAVRGTVWISGPPRADSAVELTPPPGRPQLVSPGLDETYLTRCYELVRGASSVELKRAGLLTPEIERDWPRRVGGSSHTSKETFQVLRVGTAWFGLFATLTDARIASMNTQLLTIDFSGTAGASLPGRLDHQARVLAALAALAREATAIRDYVADWLLRVDYRTRA